jgi:hypothetical protein
MQVCTPLSAGDIPTAFFVFKTDRGSGDTNPCVRAVRARSLSASSFLLLFLSPFLSLPRILFFSPPIVEFLSIALVRGLPPPALFTPPPPPALLQSSHLEDVIFVYPSRVECPRVSQAWLLQRATTPAVC